MGKIAITFDVTNKEYFDKLQEYMKLYYSHVFVFTKSDEGIVITDGKKVNKFYIVISNVDYDIYQYQKATTICKQIMAITIPKAKQNEMSPQVSCVITVTSIRGGIGKTTFSQNLCNHLIKSNKQVLYLLLDSFSPMDGEFNEDNEHDISQLIYYIEQGKDISLAIEALKSIDKTNQVSFIRCLYPSMDGWIKTDTAVKLMAVLLSNSSYDYTVIELPRHLVDGQIELMKLATHNIILTNQEDKRHQVYLTYLTNKLLEHYITCNTNEENIIDDLIVGRQNGS